MTACLPYECCSVRDLSLSCHPCCQVTKFARGAATTFAPRASGATRNPAYKGGASWVCFYFLSAAVLLSQCGCAATCRRPSAWKCLTFSRRAGSALYTVFEVQAWVSLAVGGLLSFNLLFPTDQPSIARMLGCAALLSHMDIHHAWASLGVFAITSRLGRLKCRLAT